MLISNLQPLLCQQDKSACSPPETEKSQSQDTTMFDCTKHQPLSKEGHVKDRPGFLIKPPTVRDSRKLFVGGLPTDGKSSFEIFHERTYLTHTFHLKVTEDEFRDYFMQFGTVIDSTVMVDRVTQRSRGFGFVLFEDEEVSRRLLNQEDGTGKLDMRGKEIELKKAQPKPVTHQRSSAALPRSPSSVACGDLQYSAVSMPYFAAPVPAYYHPIAFDPAIYPVTTPTTYANFGYVPFGIDPYSQTTAVPEQQ